MAIIERTLSNPAVEVNDSAIGIVPGSCSYKPGKGDKTVRPQSAGGNSIDIIITENAETKVSMVKFKLYVTPRNDKLVRQWQDRVNTIRLSDGSFSKAFRGMTLVTEPETMLGPDGELEVEFRGQPSL